MDDGVWGVFLDITKTFDEVWHEGFIFELKHNDISGKLLNILKDFLVSGFQWSVFFMGTFQCRCSTSFNTWALLIPNLH